MITSGVENSSPTIKRAIVTEDTLSAELRDGRTISVPLGWFPRLLHAKQRERANWRLIGRGQGIHWPDLDEDISAKGLSRGAVQRESSVFAEMARRASFAASSPFHPSSPSCAIRVVAHKLTAR